jgi:hypothetical protein
MARPQVADAGDGLQIWRVAANIQNKQSRTEDGKKRYVSDWLGSWHAFLNRMTFGLMDTALSKEHCTTENSNPGHCSQSPRCYLRPV